jgi:stage II sporulation protein D
VHAMSIESEPSIRIGLISGAHAVKLTLHGGFTAARGESVSDGDYIASAEDGFIRLEGPTRISSPEIKLTPVDFESCRFALHGVRIGIGFHWERRQTQSFQGALKLLRGPEGLTVVNELPLESYLVSVISSEMSAHSPVELLRAQAIVSRSWLIAQLQKSNQHSSSPPPLQSPDEIIRWYDRESHSGFDVCGDDHCQRYQGISRASPTAFQAVRDTRGIVLVFGEEVCDARYSKSCGGMTEVYRAAWEDIDVPYLTSVYDGPGEPAQYSMPLTVEENAVKWITSSPPAYCNLSSATRHTNSQLLSRILPEFDQETQDFYRWQVSYSAGELSEIVSARLGFDLGHISALEPVQRSSSARITRLKIIGQRRSIIIGKELEIRRVLSRSHLYSSAFIVRPEPTGQFHLIGAGWGHGVGLCQIGAAMMAEIGHTHRQILEHYFPRAMLRVLY